MGKLDKLEIRLQSLIEVQLMKYLPGNKAEDKITQQLAAALQTNLKKQDEETIAPNMYVVVAHPTTLAEWRADPHRLENLAEALHAAGSEAGLQFATKPTVTAAVDKDMEPGDVRILASFTDECVAETRGMPTDPDKETPSEFIPGNAFLIAHGTKVIPLNRSVINIGRRLDNHMVIDDPRISRNHAQLRAVKGNYVLFDLNSTGGTYVNGQRITQSVLYPGDVISLSGVTIIFGQDLPTTHTQEDQTEPGSAVSGNRTTVVFPFNDEEMDEPE